MDVFLVVVVERAITVGLYKGIERPSAGTVSEVSAVGRNPDCSSSSSSSSPMLPAGSAGWLIGWLSLSPSSSGVPVASPKLSLFSVASFARVVSSSWCSPTMPGFLLLGALLGALALRAVSALLC